MTTAPATIPVTFTVTSLRHLHDAGRLLVLADVTMDLGGIEIALHGVQVLRLPTGRLRCQAPRHRSHTGEWLPAVTLPEELELAIGREVMTAAGFVPDAA